MRSLPRSSAAVTRRACLSQLSQQLADVQTELADEHQKLDKGAQVAARAQSMLERGAISALDVSRMMDRDFGDEGRVRQLERLERGLRDADPAGAGGGGAAGAGAG